MNSFEIEDIDIFIDSYNKNLLNAHQSSISYVKMPLWIEFLKSKRYYKLHNIDEDVFFNKRFNITNEDVEQLHKLIKRLKNGKHINKYDENKVRPNIVTQHNDTKSYSNTHLNSDSTYSSFNEDEPLADANKFELLSQVSGAMNDYYSKMKKHKKDKLAWKTTHEKNMLNAGSIQNVVSPYAGFMGTCTKETGNNSDYDVRSFSKSPLYNMRSGTIDAITQISNKISNDNLLSHTYDESQSKNKYNSDPSSRFWQDQDILSPGSTIRKSAIKNEQPFENQFQILENNYNRVMDPRLLGQGSRLDNRAPHKL